VGTLANRLNITRVTIQAECSRLQRSEPTLIVVTKNHPVSLAEELYSLGERDFGENRVQEAEPKAELLAEHKDLNWHLIGQLQTNKVKQALNFAQSIHSLDRQSLLIELQKRTAERVIPLDVFIQLNLTDDPGRGGIGIDDVLSFADQVATVPTLRLRGLMAVAALDTEPSADFEKVAKVSQKLIKIHSQAGNLSIGMSNDFIEALQFGATHLRIGTAITGNRSV
jgi:pyridoxal phosphate enzyme (YggS family)